jgi:hypothetical protein
MNLETAAGFLGENSRYFVDVYKLYEFTDSQLLKDYLDFVIHEPVEWIRGFPSKLRAKGSFAKPKAALIKLLKRTEVVDALGASYIKKVHDIVWNTFKKHGDEILEARIQKYGPTSDDTTIVETPHMFIEESSVCGDDVESVHSVKLPHRPQPQPQNTVVSRLSADAKLAIVENALRQLVSGYAPEVQQALTTLLDAVISA